VADLAGRLQAALGSAYHVERELGGGGMSRVYVAEEVALGRKVVVKVLPPEMGKGVNAERFRREIQLAASLQHPHIVPLLNAGQTDDLVWYTMPLIEGQSLRDKLAREGELPVADAVRVLRDVADALAFAHERGVVHRDIKPDNVLLSGRHAVVTDFGVAKAISEAAGPSALTSAGIALGTPAYMAPEQATASPAVDHRADIYSLGAMAYEMLTGDPPFTGDVQEVLAAQVVESPSRVSIRRVAVPPALEALVMRCLEKKAADRWQSAAEVHARLETMATPSGGTSPTTAATPVASHTWRTVAVVAGVVAIAAAGLLVLRPRALHLEATNVSPVSSEPGIEFQPALSPDGREVAFVAVRGRWAQVIVRSTGSLGEGGGPLLVDSLENQRFPRWSADGESVRYLGCPRGSRLETVECTWKEVGRRGGGARAVSVPGDPSSAAWSPDGSRFAVTSGDSILSYSIGGGRATLVARAYSGQLHSLAWSPDSRRLAFVIGNMPWRNGINIGASQIFVVAAGGGRPVAVTANTFNVSPAWLDNRRLLYVSNRDGPRAIYAVTVGSGGPRGEPRSVLNAADVHSISYSAAGHKLAFARYSLHQNIWSYPTAVGTPTPLQNGERVTDGDQHVEEHDVSPDGRSIVFDNALGGQPSIYRRPLGGGSPVRLTTDSAGRLGPRWSPDGSEVAYYGDQGIEVVPAPGGAPLRVLGTPGATFPVWSPSGLQIVYYGAGRPRLVARDRVGGPWRDAGLLSNMPALALDWSPDGTVLLRRGADGVFILMTSTGRLVKRIDPAALRLTNGGYQAKFARDGRAIYVIASRDGRRGLYAIPVAGGAARLVVDASHSSANPWGALSLSRERAFLTVSEAESDIWVMNVR